MKFWLLAVALTTAWLRCCCAQAPAPAGSTVISASQGTAACAAQGLAGSCNGLVCCCYPANGSFQKVEPVGSTCSYKNTADQIWVTVVLAVIVLIITVLSSVYFGGRHFLKAATHYDPMALLTPAQRI